MWQEHSQRFGVEKAMVEGLGEDDGVRAQVERLQEEAAQLREAPCIDATFSPEI